MSEYAWHAHALGACSCPVVQAAGTRRSCRARRHETPPRMHVCERWLCYGRQVAWLPSGAAIALLRRLVGEVRSRPEKGVPATRFPTSS